MQMEMPIAAAAFMKRLRNRILPGSGSESVDAVSSSLRYGLCDKPDVVLVRRP